MLSERYVELWKLNKTYPSPKGPAVIVHNFTLNMKQGEFVSLIGHSGCGKSTVLSMLAGLLPKTSGNIVLAGKEVIGAGPDRGMVFQAPSLLPWMSTFDNVMLGVEQVFSHATFAERKDIVSYYLDLVGLGNAMHKFPGELSGGMRQRVGIARAFALAPKILLLDEPFGMLDQLTRIELQDVLLDLCNRDKKTAVMVTHDVDEAIFLSNRVVMMTTGPAATIGDIVEIEIEKPRHREELLESAQFYQYRERLIDFLESQDHRKPKKKSTETNTLSEATPVLVPA